MSAPKTSAEIRQSFFDFFAERAHTIVPSSPVVPLDDPTLLFTNAGMNQFKDVFLGTGARDYRRAADTQKCIRAGGKHNDLDDVGHDTYHHTFFEMLGSWSFGDYFKEDAIRWAWDLLHGTYGIPAERLHATYFAGDATDGLPPDEEARQLWLDATGIPQSHVHAFGKKDNFWEMADTGPCGPCTEIHVDLTPDLSGAPLVNADDPRVFEVWNLVFIQFNRDAASKLHTLPAQHVDTGMGFERLVTVLQGHRSNYDTDVFSPLMEAIRSRTGAPAYGATLPPGAVPGSSPGIASPEQMRDVTYRILADHLRCLTFAITDGALPDSDGRGYVLRRILRRAYRYGRQYMGIGGPFLHDLVPSVVEQMGDAFPELIEAKDRVQEAIHEEEESFARTLDTGLKLFHGAAQKAEEAGQNEIDGDTAFKLHDTYGFPIDLTRIIATERGMEVDVGGYEERMEEARQLARSAGTSEESDISRRLLDAVTHLDASFFAATRTDDSFKYTANEHPTQVVGWVDARGSFHGMAPSPGPELGVGQEVALVLESTPFYAEQGGQVGDRGHLETADGAVFEVVDTQRAQDAILHIGRLLSGSLEAGQEVTARVEAGRRHTIMANHTATHLLNHALRHALGEHVQQKGSLVDEHKTRFDFSHRQALGDAEVEAIEQHVQRQIDEGLVVYDASVPIDEARSVHSLRAVFGEKYPDVVRVVSIGVAVGDLLENRGNTAWSNYSIELCGGTHLAQSSSIGTFSLITEEAVSKGVRRLVGITGDAAHHAEAVGEALLERSRKLAESGSEGPAEGLQADIATLLEELPKALIPLRLRHRIQTHIQIAQGALKELSKAQAAERGAEVLDVAADLLDAAPEVGGSHIVVGQVPGAPIPKLREAVDWLRQKSGSAAVLLFSIDGEKVPMLAGLTDDLVARGLDAKELLREAGKIVGGGGGGKADMAQGGGKKAAKVPEAIEHLRSWLGARLGEDPS